MLAIKSKKSVVYYIYLFFAILLGLMVNIDYLTEGYKKGFDFISGCCVSDRVLNLSIIQLLREYPFFDFLDPVNKQESIFYQFGMHFVIAKITLLFNMTPLEIMNIIVIVLPIAFAIILYLIFYEISGNEHIAFLSIFFSFLFLPYTKYYDKLFSFGEHAVIISFFEEFTGPYFDQLSLLFGSIAFYFFIKHIKNANNSTLLGFIIFSSIMAITHFLPALYMLTLFFLLNILVGYKFESRVSDIQWLNKYVLVIVMPLLFWILALFIQIIPYVLYGMIISVYLILVLLVLNKQAKQRLFALILSILPSGLLIMMNTFLLDSNIGYSDRVRSINLTIPVKYYIASFAPIVVSALLYIVTIKASQENNELRYNVAFAIVVASIVWIFNASFGFNNHPYRFIPYTQPFLTFCAILFLFHLYNDQNVIGMKKIAFVAISILLVAGTLNIYKAWSNRGGLVEKNLIYFNKALDPVIAKIDQIKSNDSTAWFYVHKLNQSDVDFLQILSNAKFIDSASVNFSNKFRDYKTLLDNVVSKGNATITVDDTIYLITSSSSKPYLESRNIMYEDKNYIIMKIYEHKE